MIALALIQTLGKINFAKLSPLKLKKSSHNFFSKPLKILIIFPIETPFESNFVDKGPRYISRLPNFSSGLYTLATKSSGSWNLSTVPFICLSCVSKYKIHTNLMLIGGNVTEV